MARAPLSKLEDYELVNKDQDLRGFQACDASGKTMGRITQLIVDTDQDVVVSVVLDSGTEIPARSLEISDTDRKIVIVRPVTQTGPEPVAAQRGPTAAGPAPGAGMATVQGEIRVPVFQEFLRVGKRQAAGGTVHVHTHMERQPVQETVTLREEHVVAERRRVDRPLTEQDQRIMAAGDTDITIPTRVEVPVVAKEARVVEEVVLTKETDERRAVIKDEVRRTEVDVERTDRNQTGEPGTRK